MKNAILTLDIETTSLIAYSWGPIFESNLIEIIDQSQILSFSAKWLNGKHITKGWPDYKGYKKGVKDDKKLILDLWKLLDEAEIVITQNGKAFDIKTINSRFIHHNLPPPSPYKMVDTRMEAKRYIRLPSYSLDNMCAYFGIGKKQEHEGFPLWKKCIAGDLKAWKRMLKYNKHDVTLTEQLYLKLRPFMKTHPNLGNLMNEQVCPTCGSKNLQWRGYYTNSTTKYKRAMCNDCGHWCRSPINIQKVKLLNSI